MNMTFDEKEEDNLSIAFGFSNLSFDDGNSTIFGSSERILNCTECLNELCIPESDYDVYRWKFHQQFTHSFYACKNAKAQKRLTALLSFLCIWDMGM